MQPFYIGKGHGRRLVAHLEPNRKDGNKYKLNTIKQIQEKTFKNPPIEIYADHLTNEEACFLEEELIAFYGRKNNNTGILTNLTNGGETTLGYKFSEEQRIKKSIQMKKRWNNLSEEEKIKQISYLISSGGPGCLKGVPKSESHKQNMRKPKSEKAKKNMSIAQQLLYKNGYIQSKEHRRKNSIANTGEKNGFFGKKHTEEYKRKKSESQKNTIAAKDKNGIFYRVTKDDPRWISRELVGINKKN